MADWPDATELAQVLDVSNTEDWETTLDRVLAAAIVKVKRDCSGTEAAFDEDFEDGPDDSLAAAALRMAELMSLRPNPIGNPKGLDRDSSYQAYIYGHRRSFGIA